MAAALTASACLKELSQRARQRPARYARMTLVLLLLVYVMYQSIKYSSREDDTNSDVPDLEEPYQQSHKLRLRVRTRAKPQVLISLQSKYVSAISTNTHIDNNSTALYIAKLRDTALAQQFCSL